MANPRNVTHAGKVSGSAQIVPQKQGPTFTCNDPVIGETNTSGHNKLMRGKDNRGKTQPSHGAHKDVGARTIVPEKAGPTITCNDPAIDFPYGESPIHKPVNDLQHGLPDSTGKVIASNMRRLTADRIKTVGDTDDGGGREGYGLKKSYEKKGKPVRGGNNSHPDHGFDTK
jgi:hypothetical protein